MPYQTNPGGLGVGKRYGPLHLGGLVGQVRTEGVFDQAVFEISFNELSALPAQVISVPAFSRITEIFVEITEVFGTGDTFTVTLNGNTLTTAVIAVSALGVLTTTLTATDANRLTGTTAKNLTLDTALIDAGTPATGKAKVVVRYVKM